MPTLYVTHEGVRLGSWISNFRSKRKGRKRCALTEIQIAELNNLGMVWGKSEANWQEYFHAAEI